ncbi:hypothetical protein [Bradyrhizobium sp. SZCCHNRI2010]|uniref:hypothetical protein n=1 Tax=Bradyrhizobium sp. SZCCHNRI2010 TaxID=3057283 RepID=UPI0028E93B54|nr:hypothetical protein [Bradyrhizobium sp. SZCCHNRI2010]
MRMSDYAATRFVTLADLAEGPMRAIITAVGMGDFERPIAVLSNGYTVSLNKTAIRVLVEAYGDGDGTNFVGKEIELLVGEVTMKGKTTPAMRLQPISPPVSAATAAATAAAAKSGPKPAAKSDMDDALPF